MLSANPQPFCIDLNVIITKLYTTDIGQAGLDGQEPLSTA